MHRYEQREGSGKVDTRRSVAEIIKNIDENGMDSAYGTPKSAVYNGWRDWFCDEFMLKYRTRKFLPILYGITGRGKVNSERDDALWSVHVLYNGSSFDDREYKFDSTEDLVSWLNTPWGQPDPQKTSMNDSAANDEDNLSASENNDHDSLIDSDSVLFSESDMVDMLEVIEEVFYEFGDELSDRQYNILDKATKLIAKQVDG